MAIEVKYDILDKDRKKILKKLKFLKNSFYLAGGTALALQIGHRASIDFDYFAKDDFDNMHLYHELEKIFQDCTIEQIQNSKDTLSILVSQKIKFSFFKLPYSNFLPLIKTEYFNLVPAKEIAVMKIIALPRATYRDYVDLYYLLHEYSLDEIIGIAKKKHKNFDMAIYLKCLLSYNDVQLTPIKFKKGFEVTTKRVFSYIEKSTREYLKKVTHH